jgi:D-erythronate 2-dehydrogenase
LNGIESVIPVGPQVVHSLSSPANTVRGIIACVQTSDEAWGPLTALNLPALPMTVGAMAEGLRRIAGEKVHALLSWQTDPAIERIVSNWPTVIASPRAHALGLQANTSFDEIVREHIRENHPGMQPT